MENGGVGGPHGPVPVRRYLPRASTAPLLIWVHGGAFVKGSLDQPESHAVALALAARGIPVTTVDYRLTSQTSFLWPSPSSRAVRFPVPFDDVAAVVRDARLRSPGGVLVGGASAGACLSAAVALSEVDDAQREAEEHSEDLALPPIRGLLLAYGVLHAALPPASAEVRSRIRGYRKLLHTRRAFGVMTRNYAGSRAALSDPRAFPGGHPLSGLPTTLMIDADGDILRGSSEAFAAELAAHDVALERHVVAGTVHAFLNRPRDPGFARGIDLIAEWAARR
ncbi:alpha/beta hydrolase [Schumannella sp. 10F1B-5-1]|nr:alpha/beta hydrolase [Schumannella sp. 10F1B-5-1]